MQLQRPTNSHPGSPRSDDCVPTIAATRSHRSVDAPSYCPSASLGPGLKACGRRHRPPEDFYRGSKPQGQRNRTEEETATAEFLYREFESIGLNTDFQTFTFSTVSSDIQLLTPQSGEPLEIFSLPMSLSGRGRVSGNLVDVGKASEGELPSAGISGKIALIMRGGLDLRGKGDPRR